MSCFPELRVALYADGERAVGRLTSVTEEGDGVLALGYARRPHHEPGSVLRTEEGLELRVHHVGIEAF